MERCEQFLEASKLRYPLDLEPESPVVMIEVALEDSDLNLKKPDKRSFLDKVARNKVAHMLEETNVETYLTLACGYAKAGDWQGVEKVMSESGSQGLGFDDGDYLELMFVMGEGGHKEHIAKLLALTHPEHRGVQQHGLALGGEAGQQRPQ